MKGIIFDKDGTLLDFEAFWLPVTDGVLKDLAHKFCVPAAAEETAKQKIGIHDGKVGKNSVLCAGTYAQMSEIVRSVFSQFGTEAAEKEMYRELCRAFEENMFRGVVVPTTPDLRELLLYLKTQGIKLFVATTDNFSITSACLKKLGTEGLFDGVFTDGAGYPPKPDPYIIEMIAKEYAVPRENLLMVGDTCTDLLFARNGRIKAAYISQENEDAVLSPSPDFLIRDLNELRSVGRFLHKEIRWKAK